MPGDEADPAAFDITMIDVGKQSLRVAIKRGPKDRPPLLLFNGIGANLELAKPFMRALTRTEGIVFDVPGIGGSPPPAAPYRPSTLARLASQLLRQMGYRRADIGGVSWGGGIAQQFAHQHYDMCRKIVLAATSPGALMIPGDPRVLWKMATPRRYIDKDFMRRVAPEIYGGAFRNNPDILAAHAKAMTGATEKGYLYQLIAMAGWTSLPWLWTLKQPALILGRTRRSDRSARERPADGPADAERQTQAPRRRSPVSRHQSRRVGCDHRGVSRRMKESDRP